MVDHGTKDIFIPNDCKIGKPGLSNMWIITGPNMSGKSTFLRQVALITILAQMGSYVPATKATIGIVDQIFCRIGARDDISKSQSTFLVEMLETSNILRKATKRSLVSLFVLCIFRLDLTFFVSRPFWMKSVGVLDIYMGFQFLQEHYFTFPRISNAGHSLQPILERRWAIVWHDWPLKKRPHWATKKKAVVMPWLLTVWKILKILSFSVLVSRSKIRENVPKCLVIQIPTSNQFTQRIVSLTES